MSKIKDKVIEFVKHLPENSTIDDIVNALKEKRDIVMNTDEDDNETKIDMIKLSEHSLKDFLESEPDIYTDADLLVKFR